MNPTKNYLEIENWLFLKDATLVQKKDATLEKRDKPGERVAVSSHCKRAMQSAMLRRDCLLTANIKFCCQINKGRERKFCWVHYHSDRIPEQEEKDTYMGYKV